MSCQSVEQWRDWLPRLASARLTHAFVFACRAEAAAGASLGVLILAIGAVFAPDLTTKLVVDPVFWAGAGSLTFGFVVLMVGLHVLWAFCLEGVLTLWRRPSGVRLSLCFALYACGWDFVTSPVGVTMAVSKRGRRGLDLVREATRAPRASLSCYLVEQRGVARQRVTVFALASFVLPLLVAAGLALGVSLAWLLPF